MGSFLPIFCMKLIKLREFDSVEYVYFYVDDCDRIVSPYYESEQAAKIWFKNIFGDTANDDAQ